jgi:hypothetical protein
MEIRCGTCSEGNSAVAKQIIHKLVDDLDEGDADETIRFALDGVHYEIDLSAKNATDMRKAFAKYVDNGTKVGRAPAAAASGRTPRAARASAVNDREQNKAIRAWAKKTGRPISDRGRIPQEIQDEYHAKAGR